MISLPLCPYLCCPFQLSRSPLPCMLSASQAVTRSRWRPSAASVSGSGAGFTTGEDWIQTRNREKKTNVAGVDQDELLDPSELADSDSCFYEFKGVLIHYKVCEPKSNIDQEFTVELGSQSIKQNESIAVPIILLHGFGASVFSWDIVHKSLAKMAGTKVLAFDRPAFGLTSRPSLIGDSSLREVYKEINPYSTAFSVQATLSFIDLLEAEKAVLIGHSAGCVTAVQSYFEAPDRIAALILVAPAIVAPRSLTKKKQKNEEYYSNKDPAPNSEKLNLLALIGSIISMFSKYMAYLVATVLKKMNELITSLYSKILSAFLRSILAVMLIRLVINKFGIAAVRNAWYEANLVTDAVLLGYTKPLKVKGWERALLEYTIAMLTDSSHRKPLSERLQEISCPVLVVTGDNDRLVPIWNSRRLAQAIPGSTLEVINKCGHLPHEERAEEFLVVVQNFLQNVFHGTHQGQVQTA